MKIWIVTLEKEGDGSGNYTGWYRPSISVCTDEKHVCKVILDYMKSLDDDYADNFDKNCLNKEEVYSEIIKNGGLIGEKGPYDQLRIQESETDKFDLKTYYWDMKDKKKWYTFMDEICQYDDE